MNDGDLFERIWAGETPMEYWTASVAGGALREVAEGIVAISAYAPIGGFRPGIEPTPMSPFTARAICRVCSARRFCQAGSHIDAVGAPMGHFT